MDNRSAIPKKKSKSMQAQLGGAVRYRRHDLGFSQEELAARAGLHRTYIADVERGGRNLTLRTIACLAEALELSVQGLLSLSQSHGGADRTVGRDLRESAVREIVMVEDNPEDVELTLRAFRQARFTNPVTVITDGAQALDYLLCRGNYAGRSMADLPSLILLDLGLPKVSGLEVLRHLAESKPVCDVPVIVLTASRQDPDLVACRKLGVHAYVTKPLVFDSFCNATSQLSFDWVLLAPLVAALG